MAKHQLNMFVNSFKQKKNRTCNEILMQKINKEENFSLITRIEMPRFRRERINETSQHFGGAGNQTD